MQIQRTQSKPVSNEVFQGAFEGAKKAGKLGLIIAIVIEAFGFMETLSRSRGNPPALHNILASEAPLAEATRLAVYAIGMSLLLGAIDGIRKIDRVKDH